MSKTKPQKCSVCGVDLNSLSETEITYIWGACGEMKCGLNHVDEGLYPKNLDQQIVYYVNSKVPAWLKDKEYISLFYEPPIQG